MTSPDTSTLRPELDQAACLIARAKESAKAAGKDAGEALKILKALRADVPNRRPPAARRDPLDELSRMEASRTEALALLDTLRVALPQAETLDKKRGIADGADLQDTMQQLVSRVELELYGPSAGVTGGRE